MGKRSGNPTDGFVGKRIRMRRLMLNKSQTELADACGITFQQIQKYENGTNRVGAGRLAQIADALEVPVGFFFDGAEARSTVVDDHTKFLATREGLDLVTAFQEIESKATRRSIILMVENIARERRRPDRRAA